VPNGAPIERAYVLINSAVDPALSCFIEYHSSSNTLRLIHNNGVTWGTPLTPGSSAASSNGQCTLSAAGASAMIANPTASSSQLDLVLPLTFFSSFNGERKVFLLAVNETQNLNSGWEQKGTWSIGPPPAQPGVVLLTPRAGSGSTRSFTATFSHSGGANEHYLGYILFLPTPNAVNYTATGACLIEYNRISKGMRLIDDAGTGWIGPLEGIPLGTPGAVLENSRCRVSVQHATATVHTTSMVVTVQPEFKQSMGLLLATFLQAFDVSGNYTGMTQFGNWVIPNAAPGQPGPFVVSATPLTGTGSSATFTLTSGHSSGLLALSVLHLRISNSIVGEAACHIVYFTGNNTLNLVGDSGALVSSSGVAPGSASTLSNSVCNVNAAGTSVNTSGSLLTLVTPVSFAPSAFGGPKVVWANAFDNAGLLTHWVMTATFSVQ
jgi:hypothetical protein